MNQLFSATTTKKKRHSHLCAVDNRCPGACPLASPTAVKCVAQIKHTARAVCLPHRLCLPRRFRQSCVPSCFCGRCAHKRKDLGDLLTEEKEAFENAVRFQVQNVTGFCRSFLKRYTPTKLNITRRLLPLQHRCAESVR